MVVLVGSVNRSAQLLIDDRLGYVLKYVILQRVLIENFLESKAVFVLFVINKTLGIVLRHVQSDYVTRVFCVNFIKLKNKKKVSNSSSSLLYEQNLEKFYRFFGFRRLKPAKYLNSLLYHRIFAFEFIEFKFCKRNS